MMIRREIEYVQRGYKRGHITREERLERLEMLGLLNIGKLGPRLLVKFGDRTLVVEAFPHRVSRGKRSPSV